MSNIQNQFLGKFWAIRPKLLPHPGSFSFLTYLMLFDIFNEKILTEWLKNPVLPVINPIVFPVIIGIMLFAVAVLDEMISIIHRLTTEPICHKFGNILRKLDEPSRISYSRADIDYEDIEKLKKTKYHDTEYFGKMFIALIPFAFAAYIEIPKRLGISQDISLLFAFVVVIMGCAYLKIYYEELIKEAISFARKNLNRGHYPQKRRKKGTKR